MSFDKERTKKEIIKRLQNNPIISHVCKNVGIGKSSFYRWMGNDSSFSEAVNKTQKIGIATVCDAAKSKIFSSINSHNEDTAFKASVFILNKLDPDFKEKGITAYQNSKLRDKIARLKEEKLESSYLNSIITAKLIETLDKFKQLETKKEEKNISEKEIQNIENEKRMLLEEFAELKLIGSMDRNNLSAIKYYLQNNDRRYYNNTRMKDAEKRPEDKIDKIELEVVYTDIEKYKKKMEEESNKDIK